MIRWAIYGMIYLGSLLMIYNIFGFIRFSRYIRARGNWGEKMSILYIPVVLLVLFLVGYLAVGFLGKPDLIVAGILFGGSVFVFVIYKLLSQITAHIIENESLEARVLAAEESSKAKTSFLASISHEMRTPMNVILGQEALAQKNPDLPEETRTLVTNPELVAVNQDPLGLQPHVVQHEGNGYVFVKDVKTLRGHERAVALYNPSEEAVIFDVPAEILGFKGDIALRDLVRREDIGSSQGIRMEVPAHYARILSIKGKERLEPSVYEAEWGYIPAYNDIGLGGAKYVQMEGASCGAVVKELGGSPDNSLQWRNLHRRRGGKHTLEVRYRSDADCEAVLTVNGVSQGIKLKAGIGRGKNAEDAAYMADIGLEEIRANNNEMWTWVIE